MRARDEIVAAQCLAHADRHRCLTDVEMGQTRHLRALVELVHLLLEGPNLRHLTVHVEVLLQLHPRLDHLARHLDVSRGCLWPTRGCSSRGPVSSQAISSATICQHGTDREQFPAAENPSFVPSPPSPASKSTPQRAWI